MTEEAKDEIQDMGEDIDDFVVRTKSKTDSIIRDYTAVASNAYKGVSVLDANGNLRNTYDILLDIAKIYKEIQEEDKKSGTNRAQALIETLAGKNRSNIAASILQNPELLQEVYEASQNSAGSAMEENMKYLDSISAKMQQLQNRIQELAFTVVDSGAVKFIVDLLTDGVQLATKLVDTIGTLPTILGAAAAMLMKMGNVEFFGFSKNKKQFTFPLIDAIDNAINKEKISEKLTNWVTSNGYAPTDKISVVPQSTTLPAELEQAVSLFPKAEQKTLTFNDAISKASEQSSGFSGVLDGLVSVGGTLISTFASAGLSILAMSAASFVIEKVIDATILKRQKELERAKKAKDEMDDLISDFQENRKILDDNTDRYNELRPGVQIDGNTIRNISLTNEEFTEFLNINQQIGDAFPALITGVDNYGNHIVDLGANAEETSNKIKSVLDAEQKLIAEEAKKNLPDLIGNVRSTNRELLDSDYLSEDYMNSVESILSVLNGQETSFNVVDPLDQLTSQVAKAIDSVLAMDEFKDLTFAPGGDITANGDWTSRTYDFSNIPQQYAQSFFTQLQTALANEGVMLDYENALKLIEANTQKTISNWKTDVVPTLISAVHGDVDFLNLDEDLQSAIDSTLYSLDYSAFDDINKDDLYEHIQKSVIRPFTIAMQNAATDSEKAKLQNELLDLFNMDYGDLTNGVMQDTVDELLERIFPGDEAIQQEIKIALGYQFVDENGNVLWKSGNTLDDIYAMFGGSTTISENGLRKRDGKGRISSTDLDTLTGDQQQAIINGLDSGALDPDTIDSFEQLIKWLDELEEHTVANEDTLATLFNDEGYKGRAETYASHLSSITGAMETIRTEGQLTAEQMTELQNTFPDLFKSIEDFSLGNLGQAGADELSKWIGEIREAMKDMTPEGQAAAQTYIDNLIKSYGDLGVTMEQARKEVYSSLITSDDDVTAMRQGRKANDLISALQSHYGEDLDWNIVWQLAVNDQLSGPINEIYQQYDALKLSWDLEVGEVEIQSAIDRLTSDRELRNAEKSYAEALGQDIGTSYYENDIEISNGLIDQYERELKQLDERWNKSDKADPVVENAYKTKRAEILQSIYAELSNIEEDEDQITLAPMLAREKHLQALETEAAALQRDIDATEARGEEVSADQYRSLIDNAEIRRFQNEQLQQLYSDAAQKELEDNNGKITQDYLELTEKANTYADAVANLDTQMLEWANTIQSIDLTHLQNEMASFERTSQKMQSDLESSSDPKKAGIYAGLLVTNEAEKKNLERQRQEVIDTFNEKNRQRRLTHHGNGYDINDPEYQNYLSTLADIDAQYKELTNSTIEWTEALMNLPINALNEAIENTESELSHVQDEIALREAQGYRKTEQDYDEEIALNQESVDQNRLMSFLYKGKAGALSLLEKATGDAQWGNLAKQAEKDAEAAESSVLQTLANIFKLEDEKAALPFQALQDDLTKLEQSASRYQDIMSEIEATGNRVTAGQYQNLIDNADEQIGIYDQMIADKIKELNKAEREGRTEDVATLRGEIAGYQNSRSGLRQSKTDWRLKQQETILNDALTGYEKLQIEQQEVQNQIDAAEAAGLHGTEAQYARLAENAQGQIRNLEEQRNLWQHIADQRAVEYGTDSTYYTDALKQVQDLTSQQNDLQAQYIQNITQPYVDQIDDLSEKYDDLSAEQSQIQDNLELREKKGYKTTARDYKRLLKNAKDQKKNIEEQNALLRKQRKAIQDAGGDWSDVQDQIESNNESIRGLNSSIFDYEQSIKTSALTEAQALSSAIQQAMSEMASETGLSTDTILQLKQAFSDLKSMDISTLFYRTADGVKMSVNTLNTLIEAENTLKNNELDEQIRAQQEAMEKEAEANGTLTSAYRKMEDELLNLMNIRSQYFATYQEQLAAIDGHSLIELAKSTADPLDRYDQSREYLKEAYEMYEKGQIGSDDFKAIASYFDINGFSDEATFKENYDRYSKYFTEDATGLVAFWDNLVASGVAAKDELGNYILTMGDVEKAAEAANIPLAVFQDIIMATSDYGADVAFVTSVQDGREQLAGLNKELRDEQVKLEQLKASGAEQSVIDKQAEVVANVQNSITNLQSATDAAVYSERRSFLEGAKGAKQLWEAYSGYRDDAMKDGDIEARRFWEQMMRTLAEEYDLELKPGFEFDQEGYDQLMDEVERELDSTENLKIRFNVSDEDVTSAKNALDRAFNGNRQNIHEATQELRNYSAEELLAIDHADGVWSDGEKAVEEFAESLGLPLEKINALIIALKEMGMLTSDLGGEQVEEETYQPVYVNSGVDLRNRPQVSANKMRNMGYDVEEGSYATVFSSAYSNEDETKTVVVTPILPNGDILRQGTLEKFAGELLEGNEISVPQVELAMFQGEDSVEQANRYSEALHGVQEAFYGGDLAFQALLTTINANQGSLDKVIFGDGDVAEGAEVLEGALDGVLEQLGLGQEYGQALLYVLAQMGLIEMPELTTEVDVDTEGAKTEVENMDKELSDGTIKKEVEVETKDAKTQVQNLVKEESDGPVKKYVEVEGYSPSIKKLEEVEQNIRSRTIEQKVNLSFTEGSVTPKEVSEMSDEQIELHFGVSGAEEVQKVRDYVAEIDAANGYDLTVHIDETQMSSLLEAINPENPIEVEVDDNPWKEFVEEVENKDLTVKIKTQVDTSTPTTPLPQNQHTGASNIQSRAQNQGAKVAANVDSKAAESSVDTINDMLGSLDVGKTYITVDGQMAINQINAFNDMMDNLNVGRTYITVDGTPAITQINEFNNLITTGLEHGETNINVDTTLAKQVIQDFNNSIDSVHDGKSIISVNTSQAIKKINSFNATIDGVHDGYANVSVSGVSSAIANVKELIRQLNALNGKNASYTVTRTNFVVGGHMDEGAGFKALGTAHSLGSAHASGQDWGVPDNEDALVNEVGQESIVIFCDDIR